MPQEELWSSTQLVDAARLAVDMGDKHCADEGFRVISNFGKVAHQSQVHAHLHVVSGTSPQIGEAKTIKKVSDPTEARIFNLEATEYSIVEIPFAAGISAVDSMSQRELWQSEQILHAAQTAFRISKDYSPEGFRLISSFDPQVIDDSTSEMLKKAGSNPAGLYLLGGGQLGLYV